MSTRGTPSSPTAVNDAVAEHVFLTGATGFIGGYTLATLLERHPALHIHALVRAQSPGQATERLWQQLQLHWDAAQFRAYLPRIHPVLGDLHAPALGLAPETRAALLGHIDSVLHVAASLNRKSLKACINTNLRGTLSVVLLARDIAAEHGLRRYSHVSTMAVSGHRAHEVVTEDEAVDWNRSDYDPYGATKKVCEHLARELLPDVPKTFFRPTSVIGDARRPETTQFDMVRAFCFFTDLPLIPLGPDDRQDIVNVDWVARAIATLHVKESPRFDTYHLSAGTRSETTRQVAEAMARELGRRPRFAPQLLPALRAASDALARSKARNAATLVGSLVSVFLPYLTWDTVFDNARVVAEVGEAPTPFSQYCGPLYRYAKRVGFTFPAASLPEAMREAG